jgi:transcriptional regulator with XRE-family HTH domain
MFSGEADKDTDTAASGRRNAMTPTKLKFTAWCEALGITQAEVSRRTSINASTISLVARGRFIPYDSQLFRIKAAIGYEGDPHELLEPVDG